MYADSPPALLLLFGLLLIGFAAWNVNSTLTTGQHGSSVFMLFTNCLLVILISSATIEHFKPHIRSANVLVECTWVAIVALFQLGAAISTTTSGSFLTCQRTNDWSICASSTVLVPVTWINTFIAFTYFFALSVSAMSHVHTYPDIWARTLYTVDWFMDPRLKVVLQHATSQPRMISWSEYLQGMKPVVEKRYHHTLEEGRDVEKAPWAENTNVRRGKDDPYASSVTCSRSGRSTPPPPLPSKTHSKASSTSSFGSRFVERLSRERNKSFILPQINTTSPFPSTIVNHDLPIPLPHKSEWVPADRL
ncbi:hypothetical protein AN958_11280 [Leucoagaricus sp. SymC.cos]|nr:hypothetical protein AN958_11280 [Leucoagaricus sp. SymC.cos]